VEINGVAHTFLTSGNFTAAREFYSQLLPYLGMKPVIDGDGYYYCIGGKTGVGIRASERQGDDNRFDQSASGLHHLCFRMRSREDVDQLHEFLISIDTRIVHGPQEDGWAPGYYSILFEDPDGIRLEANFVPGKGLLA
jgi:catechol 2,3-dioxygenase-like lactoylglutathione lyase family enzyme